MRKLILIAILLSSTTSFAIPGNNGGGNGGCGVGQTTNGCGGTTDDNGNSGNDESNNGSNVSSDNNVFRTSRSVVNNNNQRRLPNAPPAVAPTVIGVPGSDSISGGISTPFGGISLGKSSTIAEARRVLGAQATAQDIENIKAAEALDPYLRKRIIKSIIRRYR